MLRDVHSKPKYNCCILIAEDVKNKKVNSNYARKNEYNKIKEITTFKEIVYSMTDIQRHFQFFCINKIIKNRLSKSTLKIEEILR